jgi:hypothetical protein
MNLAYQLGPKALLELAGTQIPVSRKGGMLSNVLSRLSAGQAKTGIISFCDWVFLIETDLNDLQSNAPKNWETDQKFYREWFPQIPVNQWNLRFLSAKFSQIDAADKNTVDWNPGLKPVPNRADLLRRYSAIHSWQDYVDFVSDAKNVEAIDQINSNCNARIQHPASDNYRWTDKGLPILLVTRKQTSDASDQPATPGAAAHSGR